jgi:signal transduction histidine kinase
MSEIPIAKKSRPAALAHRDRLIQVLTNLIGNAIDARR